MLEAEEEVADFRILRCWHLKVYIQRSVGDIVRCGPPAFGHRPDATLDCDTRRELLNEHWIPVAPNSRLRARGTGPARHVFHGRLLRYIVTGLEQHVSLLVRRRAQAASVRDLRCLQGDDRAITLVEPMNRNLHP
jgi:hypothetical protein